jgi:uncharacterized protein (DUF1786 family)
MTQQGGMSVADDSLDQMVQAASTPTLSTLFRRAKEAGVITPVAVYGEGMGGGSTTTQQPPF